MGKTKCQNLEWQKQNGQKLKWQKQNFPMAKLLWVMFFQMEKNSIGGGLCWSGGKGQCHQDGWINLSVAVGADQRVVNEL